MDPRYQLWNFQVLGSFIEDVRDVGSLRIANFIYKSDNLHEVGLGTAFRRVSDSEDGLVKAPIIILATDSYELSFGENTSDWRLVRKKEYLGEFLEKEGDSPNKIKFTDADGKDIYYIEWRIGEIRWPQRDNSVAVEGTLVVERTHVPSKTIQTLTLPLSFWPNFDRLRTILLSKPPYKKDENGRLVVPWRNIDRIVGASLSYSYLPQTPQE